MAPAQPSENVLEKNIDLGGIGKGYLIDKLKSSKALCVSSSFKRSWKFNGD